MVGMFTSPGGLQDTMVDGKLNHMMEDDIPSRVELEAPPRTPENELEWAKMCVAQMEEELAGHGYGAGQKVARYQTAADPRCDCL